MKILVGLGNFEDKYVGTRHNVGRDFLMWFAQKHRFTEWKKDSFLKALVATGDIGDEDYILVLPETYMNLSGQTVAAIFKKWSGVRPEEVTVIHDEIDVNFGEIKVSTDKGHGGHNGVRSILDETKLNLRRIRIGICPKSFLGGFKKPHKDEVADFVLKRFGMLERGEIEGVYGKAEALL